MIIMSAVNNNTIINFLNVCCQYLVSQFFSVLFLFHSRHLCSTLKDKIQFNHHRRQRRPPSHHIKLQSLALAVMNTSGLAEKRQSELLLNELNLLYMHRVIENGDASAASGLMVAALPPAPTEKKTNPNETKGCV